MDNLFRLVFKNVIIRNQIFRFVRILNKDLIVKKYNQCNMGWIIKNGHFHLLLYKLKKHIKRDQFSEELFYRFLQGNSELHLLKDMFKIFPQFLPSTPIAENILIEHCSSLKPTKNLSPSSSSYSPNFSSTSVSSSSSDSSFSSIDSSSSSSSSSNQEFCEQSYDYDSSSPYDSSLDIIKYLTNELNIKVTNKAINNACAANNCKIVGYYLGLNQLDRYKGNEIDIYDNCNIGTLFCSLRGKDFQLFKFIFENNPNLTSQCISYDKFIKLMVATGDIQFIIHFGRVQGPSYKPPQLQPYMIAKSSLSIIKYLCSFLKINDPMKNQSERFLLLKFLIEEFRIYEKVEGSTVVQEVVYSFCGIGDLDCIIYLRDFYLTLPQNHSFKFLIPRSALDVSISSKNFHVTNWILENTNVCCSINGLRYLCKNMANLKHILDRILIKFVPIRAISSKMLLDAMHSTNRIAHDKENFDYLASFLPNHLIPTFPIETSIEDYDY
ncbi:hypothetical protein DDB_G0271764 [Dictyostelium discoideum AX4]|uniref:Uncharacterized protein n=1 Tax=Dictyostelium discoideum TaxID=44689 RepID=Q55AL0_DICDI|nr:hypothetical protein DDB_G0271764 [Dictyostelium discoideum AX4]EAL71572.1 hypothetical protein DDB_G0271764 [Dictyostelium discoideum AX4]|eukprot:XP_645512.1 hypothetical protein DDB_G0271764 [Dictyostelium discoideum AX4]